MTSADGTVRAPREQVLDVLLDGEGPLDAADVAGRLGIHVTTARFHLDNLARQALVQRRSAPTGRRGRPRVLYSPAAGTRTELSRARLIDVLSGALADDATGSDRARHAGAAWAESLPDADAAGADAAHIRERLITALEESGFAPEPDPAGILLRECPFRDAARAHPEVVCAVHRGFVERLAAPDHAARLVPFVTPDTCLVTLGDAGDLPTR